MKHTLSIIFLSLFLFSLNPTSTLAQIKIEDQLISQGNPFKIQRTETIILGATNLLLIIAGVSLFICIIYSGLQYQFAGADKSNLESSKSRLTNCIIGLTVVLLAYAIILIVQYFFGITLFP